MEINGVEDLLERLRQFIEQNSNRAFFNAPASAEQLGRVETSVGVALPPSWRRFLSKHDGGFISVCGNSSDPDWDIETAVWNSNVLLGTDQIIAEHAALRQAVHGKNSKKALPYLPFCRTESQEHLVLAAASAGNDEPAVLDAFHEEETDEWGELYPNFSSFLMAYLDGQGNIEQVAD
jgi:SMI1 / KNR4 family (SUKH-1)